ncbi:MAG: hypothetical protein A2787_05560 [Omnitrophica WOR_2 bacterium RIFCSPHIGHO2_01_FULL_48_9]|nr:MAG: hypothetical protein A2787_05560 [Omnitrophica WOR_2 bacterium RIFCSPHIGHO2_01_FULL_48_9]
MFKVINRQVLANGVRRLDILAEPIARKIQPGQFVIVTITQHGDKISLPVAEIDANRRSLVIIFRETDLAAQPLGRLQIDDEIFLVAGPYGNALKIEKLGTVACVADEMGIVQILPIVRAMKQVGNKVCSFLGARTKSGLILQSQLRLASYKIFMATQDGSWERRGVPSDALRDFLYKEKIEAVYVAGSVDLMQKVAEVTLPRKIKTWAQLNPPMLDGTGACGSCRVTVDGRIRLACVDGPVFDAHGIDFEDYKIRINAFQESVWDNRLSLSSPQRNGSAIFGKFLSGILRK